MSKSQSVAPRGQPSHTPKVRIHGVQTGSPTYNALVDKFSGLLGAFHMKHQQQVALSGNNQYKAKTSWPGARAMYHNNNGQETITMVVDPKFFEGGKPEHFEEYWDWVLIELDVPDMTETSAEFAAFQEPPPPTREGWARDGQAWSDMPNPALAYPRPVEGVSLLDTVGGASDQHSSLLVDLRSYREGYKFDLYGNINKYEEPSDEPTNTEYDAVLSAGVTRTGTSALGGGPGSAWDVGDISGRTRTTVMLRTGTSQADVEEQHPETAGLTFNPGFIPTDEPAPADGPAYLTWGWTWDSFLNPGGWYNGSADPPTSPDTFMAAAGGAYTETLTFWPNGELRTKRGIGVVLEDHLGNRWVASSFPSSGTTNEGVIAYMFDYTKYYIGSYEMVHVLIDRTATIRFVFLKGGRPKGFSNHFNDNMSCDRWEGPAIYPTRWEFKELAQAVTIHGKDIPITGSAANHFELDKLGTFKITPSMKRSGVKFDLA